jgi:tRNA A-37 threonylcarbamoyl transferase component Bud32
MTNNPEEEYDEGLAIFNYKLANLAEKVVPKDWLLGVIGRTHIFFDPKHPEILNAWERQHKVSKGDATKRNTTFSLGTTAVGPDGKRTRIQVSTRLLPPAFPELKRASQNGVRVEKPIAMFFDGRSRPTMIFEHVEGETLNEILTNCPATTEENRSRRIEAIKAALNELGKLHKLNIYHWDATANNIMHSKDGATLIDIEPGYIVNAIRKSSKHEAKLASKPTAFDFSRFYASIDEKLTNEEKTLFKGKISDDAVKFHKKQLEESRKPQAFRLSTRI